MMNKLISGSLLCLAGIGFITGAHAQTQEGIKVVGKASTMLVPDTFVVRFGFERKGRSASKLKQVVDSQASQLTRYAKSLGIDEKHIKSSQLTVNVRYPKPSERVRDVYMATPESKASIVKVDAQPEYGYEQDVEFTVSRSVEFRLIDLANYDKLLDNSVKLGATRIDPLQSFTSSNEEAYQALLKSAINNARTKAAALLSASGAKVGKVISIEEQSHYQARPKMMAAEAMTFHRSHAGTQGLTAEVSVTYAIEHD